MATLPLTRQWLERTYLQGVDLTDDNGEPFPDVLYRLAFKSAVDSFFMQTNVTLLPVKIVERHDYNINRAVVHHFLKTRQRPVLRDADSDPPKRVTLRYIIGQNAHVFDLPPEWILEVIPEAGQIQVLPISRDGASYPITTSGRWFGVISTGVGGGLPGWYEVTYWAGFPEGDLLLIHDLVGDLTRVHREHRVEIRGTPPIHGEPDTVNTLAANGGAMEYVGETEAEAIAQGNALKAAHNGHAGTAGTIHGQEDVVNVISAPDATDRPSLVILLNEARLVMAAHLLALGPAPTIHGVTDEFRAPAASPVRDDYVQLPGSILHCIGMLASMFVLNPAGDLISGAGIANLSIGIDSLHQTIGTTSSATNAGYGARIIQYAKDLKELLPRIRRFYFGFSMR